MPVAAGTKRKRGEGQWALGYREPLDVKGAARTAGEAVTAPAVAVEAGRRSAAWRRSRVPCPRPRWHFTI